MVSAWSIPQAKREINKININLKGGIGSNEHNPGVGEYQVGKQMKVVQTSPPQYSIGQSGRSDLRCSEAPSIGTYKLPNILGKEGPKYHIGERRNLNWEEREKQRLPGPASYSPQTVLKKSPAYSIPNQDRSESPKGRNQQLNKSVDAPGPGQYDINRTTLNGPSTAKMGSQKREDLVYNRENPGVGKYNISQQALDMKRKFPQFSIGSQERSDLANGGQDAPGVGKYHLKSMLSSKGGTIGKQNYHEKRDQSPGIGAYNLIDQAQAKYGTIGKDKRKDLASIVSPGPSKYELLGSEKFKLKNTPKYSIGSSQRIPLGGSDAPGMSQNIVILQISPQKYFKQDVWNSNKGTSISSKYYNDQPRETPGPQSYRPDYDQILSKKAAYTTSKSVRDGIVNLREKAKIPGPADYRNYEAKKFRTPQYSIGRSNRSAMDLNSTPGPGSYNLPPKFADVPKYLMPNKPKIF